MMPFIVLTVVAEERGRRGLQEVLLALGLVGGAGLLGWLGPRLPLALIAPLWGLLLGGLALLLRHRFRQLFGPVFVYDLVRTARRGQQIGHRCLYAGLLLLLLLVLYCMWFPYRDLEGLMQPVRLRPGQVSEFATYFFQAFMVIQFGVVLLVTPAYTATAIAEEKERRTLEFLLATDLSNREVVLGMLGARLANLGLLVLTGLPILALLQVLGGVDFNLVLAGFLATFMVMLSVGSMSILVSVYARTALGAVVQTYFWVCLVMPTAMCLTPALSCCNSWFGPSTTGTPQALASSSTYIIILLLIFSVLQGVVAAFCCRWAVTELRSASLGTLDYRQPIRARTVRPRPLAPPKAEQPEAEKVEQLDWGPFPDSETAAQALEDVSRPAYRRFQRLPPVGDDALFWKENYGEQRLMPADLAGFLIVLLGVILLIQVIMMLATSAWTSEDLSQSANQLVHPWAMILLFLILIRVALSAANRVSRERERQTLDGLLTLPVSPDDILFAKWLASIRSGRWLWWCLGAVWGVGVLTTGISPASLPLVVAASVVYTTFIATLGLWFSSANRTTLRSTLFTILATLVVILGPGMLVRLGGADLARSSSGSLQWDALIGEYGLTPSATLRVLTFRTADLQKGDRWILTVRLLSAVGGLHLYMAVTGLLWLSMRARFQADKGPAPRRPPPS
jgi:ABC-type transport system involved in multi-copper enzyme maturation permease subunit